VISPVAPIGTIATPAPVAIIRIAPAPIIVPRIIPAIIVVEPRIIPTVIASIPRIIPAPTMAPIRTPSSIEPWTVPAPISIECTHPTTIPIIVIRIVIIPFVLTGIDIRGIYIRTVRIPAVTLMESDDVIP
jgi:hypothetical protein